MVVMTAHNVDRHCHRPLGDKATLRWGPLLSVNRVSDVCVAGWGAVEALMPE